jgi:predicted dehydrogenase
MKVKTTNETISHSLHPSSVNRRQFLKQSGTLALGASVLGSVHPSGVFAAESQTIRLALIGCGGRGSGAVSDALSVPKEFGPVELYAMADVQEQRLQSAYEALVKKHGQGINVTRDRQFVGFKAYQAAIDLLRPGDVALCTTRSYIRPIHVEYAIRKGINVFMEKPFASDPGGLHRILRANAEATRRNVKVMSGLQCRHSPARQALIDRLREGKLGDIVLLRANRLGGAHVLSNQGAQANQLMSQLQFGKVALLWVGSGHMVDNLIHQIDECCWIKDAWPVSAVGMGGRVPNDEDLSQNLGAYAMEYTFADGTKAFCGFRRMNGARNEFATFIHGSRCAAQFSGKTHAATVHQFKDQRIGRDNIDWTPPADVQSPWQYEWNVFIENIRKDRPHNELERAVYSDLATLMGRAATHTGQTVTWEEMMESRFQFCDYLDELGYDSPAPVQANALGQFPQPIPGEWREL